MFSRIVTDIEDNVGILVGDASGCRVLTGVSVALIEL